MNIEIGRYWSKPWSLVDGCTPCSPGCDHCWSARMAYRFDKRCTNNLLIASSKGFTGKVIPRPDRLNIPLRTRKPTVFALWNDLFHEAVPASFIDDAYEVMAACPHHTFLILTKRAHNIMSQLYDVTADCPIRELGGGDYLPNAWHGLTVCNQAEADEKVPIFLQVPGNKFLSIEPMMGPVDIEPYLPLHGCRQCKFNHDNAPGCNRRPGMCSDFRPLHDGHIDAVVLGGETGPGARPMHPDWVRSVRDQCAAAGVPFFLKNLGMWSPSDEPQDVFNKSTGDFETIPAENAFIKKKAGRVLDGRTHDDLPWIKKDDA